MDEKDKIINLGYANGWKETPELVANCDHNPRYEKDYAFSCVTHVTCDECGYTYKIDSSG